MNDKIKQSLWHGFKKLNNSLSKVMAALVLRGDWVKSIKKFANSTIFASMILLSIFYALNIWLINDFKYHAIMHHKRKKNEVMQACKHDVIQEIL